MKRALTSIDPSTLPIGSEAPFRYRYILPGEPAAQGAVAGAECDAALVESVARFGIIHPPMLLEATDLAVLSGHRRVAAAAAARLPRIDAFLVSEQETTKREIASIWLEEARLGTPLSELERITLTKKCLALAGADFDECMGELSSTVGRKLSRAYIERTRRLLELPREILEALHRGSVSTGDLLILSESRTVDTVQAASILAHAALNRKEQRNAVQLMLRLGDLGPEAWDRFALAFEEGGKALLPSLAEACHPSLTLDRGRIEEIIRGICLPGGAALSPPENLEGGSYRLTARIRSEEALAGIVEKLAAALRNGSISRLLYILKGEREKEP
jgi:hypothetical protein